MKLGITAIDTDAGKTMITGTLLAALRERKIKAVAVKPVASGCIKDAQGVLHSQDADFLLACMPELGLTSADILPYRLEAALTPAVAAKLEKIALDKQTMLAVAQKWSDKEVVLVEGVGGLAAPLLDNYLVVDYFADLNLPIVLVTNNRLGCINHTVLSVKYAQSKGLKVLGIIVNLWEENTADILATSNLQYMQSLTGVPIIGKFPKVNLPLTARALADYAEQYLDLDGLIVQLQITEGERK